MRQFRMAPSSGGAPSFALPLSDYNDARLLAAGVAETVTVPPKARIVVFSADATYYVRSGGTATVPAGDVTDGTASAMNPAAREVEAGSTFSVISPVACILTLEWFA